jgi:hypothetical protein
VAALIFGLIGAGERVRAGYEVSRQLTEMRNSGLLVYAGVSKGVLHGGTEQMRWRNAIVQIRRTDDPEVLRAGIEPSDT